MSERRPPVPAGYTRPSAAMRRSIGWFIVYALFGVGVLVSIALPAWDHDGASVTSVFWTIVGLVLAVLAARRLLAARAASRAGSGPP